LPAQASVGVSVLSIILALAASKLNVTFLVSVAFAIAASANLPVILFTIFWKRFNTIGAVTGMLVGLISAIVLCGEPKRLEREAGGGDIYREPLVYFGEPSATSYKSGDKNIYRLPVQDKNNGFEVGIPK
jgi:cation/acetate symporter